MHGTDGVSEFLLAKWPGVLTIIVNDRAGKGAAAYRCPGDVWLRNIMPISAII